MKFCLRLPKTDLSGQSLKGQFILAKSADFDRGTWNMFRKDSWALFFHPSLPVADALTKDGKHIGWVLGYPVDMIKSKLCSEKIIFDVNFENITTENIESQLYGFGGRFVGIFLTDKFSRLYLDPAGSLSVVYDLENPLIASAPALLDKGNNKHSRELLKDLDRVRFRTGTPYPCGLTPLKNIKMILPNHFLDLRHWKIRRHWPKAEIKKEGIFINRRPKLEEAISLIRSVISAAFIPNSPQIALSGGRDSRILLACSRGMHEKISFCTYPRGKDSVDSKITAALAELFDLKHETNLLCDAEKVILLGFGGEVSRGYYWKKGDKKKEPPTVKDLLERINYPDKNRYIRKEMQNWLSEISGFSPLFIVELMYIEQRLGCCMGPVMYDYDQKSKFSLYPMNNRRLFELMLGFPSQYKRKCRLTDDICATAWPELLDVPCNAAHFVGISKYRKFLRQLYGRLTERPTLSNKKKRAITTKMTTRGQPFLKMFTEDLVKGTKIFRK